MLSRARRKNESSSSKPASANILKRKVDHQMCIEKANLRQMAPWLGVRPPSVPEAGALQQEHGAEGTKKSSRITLVDNAVEPAQRDRICQMLYQLTVTFTESSFQSTLAVCWELHNLEEPTSELFNGNNGKKCNSGNPQARQSMSIRRNKIKSLEKPKQALEDSDDR